MKHGPDKSNAIYIYDYELEMWVWVTPEEEI